MQDLETAIRRHLLCYLAGDVSLDEFTDWLVGVTWNIEAVGSAPARNLAASIELALAEASSGLLTLDELHAELRAILEHVNIKLLYQPEAEQVRDSNLRPLTKTWLVGNLSAGKITGIEPLRIDLHSALAERRLVAALA